MAYTIRPKVIDGSLVFKLPTGHYLVQSKSNADNFRWVGPAFGELYALACSCEGFEYGAHCRHVDAALRFESIPEAEPMVVEAPISPSTRIDTKPPRKSRGAKTRQ